MSLNFCKRLYSWREIPATAWRDRGRVFMVPCITLAHSVIVAFQANSLLAAGKLALAGNADNYKGGGRSRTGGVRVEEVEIFAGGKTG